MRQPYLMTTTGLLLMLGVVAGLILLRPRTTPESTAEPLPAVSSTAFRAVSVPAAPTGFALNIRAVNPARTRYVAPVSDGTFWLWEADGTPVGYIWSGPMGLWTYSADGSRVAGIYNGAAYVWSTREAAPLAYLPPSVPVDPRSVWPLVFSPDGRLLAAAGCESLNGRQRCAGTRVHLWDVEAGIVRFTWMEIPLTAITELTFNAEGTELRAIGCVRYESAVLGRCGQAYPGSVVWSTRTGRVVGGS
ncbi:MAG TPA: WD40 repeat domain-containing protein [Aggregatilineales bacterium]|nr:WD40 repeat domain-containing protein [Aggregatilineales bacterium]